MKKALQKVLKDKKGFTLAELLIVVAIIAILVAISVPIFTGQLTKSKESTDDANIRSAKAAAVAEYLNKEETSSKTYYYDADEGKVVTDTSVANSIKAYSSEKTGNIVKVVVTDGSAKASWVKANNVTTDAS